MSPRQPAASDARTPLPLEQIARLSEPLRTRLQAHRERAAADPNDARAVGALGMACYANDLPTAAAACFARAMELDPSASRWPYFLGLAYEQSEETRGRAGTLYDRVLTVAPDYAPALNRLGDRVVHRDARRAEELFQRALEINDKDVVALRGLALCRRLDGRGDSALEYARRALALAPDYADANLEASLLLKEAGKTDEAAEYSRRYEAGEPPPLDLDPLLKELLSSTGGTPELLAAAAHYVRTGDLPRAFRLIWLAIEKEGTGNEARMALASLHLRRGQPSAAERVLREVVRRDPKNLQAQSALGFALGEQHAFEEAENLYRAVLARDPREPLTLGRLAMLLLRRARPREAMEALETLNRLQPRVPEQHFALAVSLACLRRYVDAAAECKQTMSMMGLAPGAKLGLADRLARLSSEYKQSGATTRPAEAPEFLAATDFAKLAEALLRQNLHSEARDAYANAIAMDSALSEAYRPLLELIRKDGQEKAELQLLQRAAAALPNEREFARELAMLLCTARDDAVRNGAQAREIAEQLCKRSQFKDPADLLTLAAAYAEARDFEQAIDIAQTAKKYDPPPEAARELDRCLDLFHKKRPIRRPEHNESTN